MQSACFSPGTQLQRSSSFVFALGLHEGGASFGRHERQMSSVTNPASSECSATQSTSLGPIVNEHVPSIWGISSVHAQSPGAASTATSGREASRGGRVGFGWTAGGSSALGPGSVDTTAPPQATIRAPGRPIRATSARGRSTLNE